MPKRAVFERSRGELSLNVSVGVHIMLVVEQSSLESQSRGCTKTPILTLVVLSVACNNSDSEIRAANGIFTHNTHTPDSTNCSSHLKTSP